MPTNQRYIGWTIIAVLGPLWLYNLTTSTFNASVQVPFYSDPFPAQGHPTVRGVLSPQSNLRAGDEVLSVDGEDTAGFSQPKLLVAILTAHHAALQSSDQPVVRLEVRREGRTTMLEERLVSSNFLTFPIQSVTYGIVAILILWRAPTTQASRALFYALFAYAMLYSADPIEGFQAYLALTTAFVAILFTQPLLLRAFMSFPEEANMLRGIHRFWPVSFALVGALVSSSRYGFPLTPDQAALPSLIGVTVYIVTLIAILTRNYVKSSPTGKRQIKWILYGVYVGAFVALVTFVVAGTAPVEPPWWFRLGIAFASVTAPITILIAVLRFDLLDINRVIGTTAVYNLLLFALAGAIFFLAPRVSRAVSDAAGIQQEAGQALFAVLFAALLLPAARAVRPYLDQLFFKERVAFERGVRALADKLVVARTPEDLWQTSGSELMRLLRPASCVIYSSAGAQYVPVFARGRSVPPVLPAPSPLLEWFRSLDSACLVRTRDVESFDGIDRAFLESLGAQAAIPITRNRSFEAILCLGEKHSGDIYTSTDIALLNSMASNLSAHLMRFDQSEMLDRARATQDALRQYVPGAIADEIDRGATLEEGERRVSVLFVDIRGYTAYAIQHEAADIFSTVNRYTECVSRIVRECGGSVVEFNGDGMMAVFGAPVVLPRMEAAALRAGRALVAEVPKLADDDARDRGLNVGVGIATGSAFVGNIQAVDRVIWSAIGNTTNLAARLQALTRDLEASIIVDTATRKAAGEEAVDLQESEAVIRGRGERETVFLLPLSRDADLASV